MIFETIALAVAATAAIGGYRGTRRFVRHRLRFVDAAQTPLAPAVAGVAALVLAAPVVALLPVIGAGTALAFGAGVGVGTRAGARDIRSGYRPDDG
jgi:hypothetical protein